ncbi:DUF3331 domain-containing protein [Paraburkholderia diazotrophica]|uniref:DUF3331 domain-containing protein n=1 Tax=Paraburkholderia diazotrophica TaxID=667676 RepID=UPI00316D923A
MAELSEDNRVLRTLLNVLSPPAEQLDACSEMHLATLENRRNGVCPPVTDDHRHLAKRPSNIMVVDRLSPCTISVSWSDPCAGRSIEQIWRSGRAPFAAICVLTGCTINRGDRVFRPQTREMRVPPNCYQMILAETIGNQGA